MHDGVAAKDPHRTRTGHRKIVLTWPNRERSCVLCRAGQRQATIIRNMSREPKAACLVLRFRRISTLPLQVAGSARLIPAKATGVRKHREGDPKDKEVDLYTNQMGVGRNSKFRKPAPGSLASVKHGTIRLKLCTLHRQPVNGFAIKTRGKVYRHVRIAPRAAHSQRSVSVVQRLLKLGTPSFKKECR
jgi:hypothetical protein